MKVHLLQSGITAFLTQELTHPTDTWLLPHSMVNHFHTSWYNHTDLSLYDRYDHALRSDISQRWWKREHYRPKEIMLTLIETDPELAGIAWKDLAQPAANLEGRLSRFTYYCEQLLDMYRARHPRAIETFHHQDATILSLYLAGLFPDLYALYPGIETFQQFCKNVGSPDIPKVDDLVRYMKVVNIVNTYLQRDQLLSAFFEKRDPVMYKVQPITMIITFEIVQFIASQDISA
jgi:hypothetical protein